MNFNSIQYLLFLGLNLLVYYLLPRRARNVQLLLASYFFYMCWNPAYALLMLFSTAVTYGCGLLVGNAVWGKRRLWVALSLLLNLGVLFFFKYYNFAAGLLSDVIHAAGLGLDVPLLDVLLPVGISFYTFQALGYTIDVYRKDVEAEKNFIDYALFISFFPQLVAGPIERSGHILHQLKEYHPFRYENIKTGIYPVLWGLFKKVVIADNLASMVNTVYNHPQNQGGRRLPGGHRGLCLPDLLRFLRLLRHRPGLRQNAGLPPYGELRLPLLRRLHPGLLAALAHLPVQLVQGLSLLPLGGSRKGKARTCLNVMIVFFVSGLWHGAALTFVAWGLLNGLYQVVSKLIDPLRQKLLSRLPIRREGAPYRCFQVAVTFVLTCIAWVLFRANSLPDALTAYQAICSIPVWGFNRYTYRFSGHTLGLPMAALVVALCALLLGVMDWLIHSKNLFQRLDRTVALRYAGYFLLAAAILLFGSYGEGYDPQAFVYFQF